MATASPLPSRPYPQHRGPTGRGVPRPNAPVVQDLDCWVPGQCAPTARRAPL